jgi:hypothetical protein
MAIVNHAKKEIHAKIVYYGPAQCGKSTTLTYIFSRIKPSLRGELKCVPAGADNLLFFDFSPFETPLSNGYRIRFHVYTLTGAVTNPATWKMTLKGVDGIMIVVNPAEESVPVAVESVAELRDFLAAYGVGLFDTPAVLQFNSFTRKYRTDDVTQVAATLNLAHVTLCHSTAATGEGLLEALATLSRQVLDRITITHEPTGESCDHAATLKDPDAVEPDRATDPTRLPEIPVSEDKPHVALLSHEVLAEKGSIRIPLVICHGTTRHRLVVTVNVELGQDLNGESPTVA